MHSVDWCLETIASCLYKHRKKIYYYKSLPHDELSLSIACYKAKKHIEEGTISKEEFDKRLTESVTRKKPKTDITNP